MVTRATGNERLANAQHFPLPHCAHACAARAATPRTACRHTCRASSTPQYCHCLPPAYVCGGVYHLFNARQQRHQWRKHLVAA